MYSRRTFLASAASVAGLAATLRPGSALAQAKAGSYPSRNVTMVVPFPAGGPVERFFRPVSEMLSERLKQTFILEPRGGANGTIGLNYVTNAQPDGYTLLASSVGPVLIGPFAMGREDFDVFKALTPIAQMISSPSLIVARASAPFNTLPELIAYAKANPGKLNFGTTGAGGITDLVGARLADRAGINMVRVHYQGAAQLITDMLGDRMDLSSLAVSVSLPHLKTGKLKGIAVTNATRARVLPDTPTVAETLPGFQSDNWNGMFGPPNLPRPIVDLLAREIGALMKTPELLKIIETTGLEPAYKSTEDFIVMLREDAENWKSAIKAAGFKPK